MDLVIFSTELRYIASAVVRVLVAETQRVPVNMARGIRERVTH